MVKKLALLFFYLSFLISCRSPQTQLLVNEATATINLITATPSATATATRLPQLSPSPPPTIPTAPTTTPPPPPSPPASATPPATRTETPEPTPTDSVDRSCFNPGPQTYRRFWLSAEQWPRPVDSAETHLWYSKPLPPGAGRLLINRDFPYGWDNGAARPLLLHNGVDVSEELGTPVLAVADGTVVTAGEDLVERFGWRCNWYGHLVVIKHDDIWQGQPVYSLYGHVLNINVEVGQRIKRGEQVAEVGFGGAAKVRHLHFEIRVGQNDFFSTRNPLLWLQPAEGRGVLAGRLVDPHGNPWQGVPIIAVPRSADLFERRTWSYLGDEYDVANPDEQLAENFVIGDLKAGEYILYTSIQGVDYNVAVEIRPNQVNTIEIITEPLKQP